MFTEEAKPSIILNTTEVPKSTWYDNLNKISALDKRADNKGRPVTQFSKKKNGTLLSNSDIISILKSYRREPFFINGGGYKKLTYYLKREHDLVINKKKIYRLCKEAGILLPNKLKKGPRRTPISVNRVVDSPFQLWELDIKYGYIWGERRFFFLLAIIDVYLRYIVGYHIGLQCLGSDLVRTLSLAMKSMNLDQNQKLVIRMDNGPQMTSNTLFKFADLHKDKLIHELIPVRTPNKDAHIESFYSIIEVEFFQTYLFENYLSAYLSTNEYIHFYQNRRIHSALKYRTPSECLDLYKRGNLEGIRSIHL